MEGNAGFYGKCKDNPFADACPDPLCELNLRETSDFVKSFPMANSNIESRGFLGVSTQRKKEGGNSVANRRVLEAPPTPGRPVFSFSTRSLSRKSIPSKWDDAEKWLISSSCNDSPANGVISSEPAKICKQGDNFKQQQVEVFAEKSRVTEEKVSSLMTTYHRSVSLGNHNSLRAFHGVAVSSDAIQKGRFWEDIEPIFPYFKCSEPCKEGFIFKSTARENMMKDAATEVVREVKHRDVGTEMTPLGSSTTSRCPTPFLSTSPARHNTPASRSGPLAPANLCSPTRSIDISQLQECHLAKLQLTSQVDSVTSTWSTREEEEKEISRSLRHFESGSACRKSVSDSRAAGWEEEEKTKCCLRYQREDAKIQAWVNLQTAKAEAESRKLEVKIEKMRSDLEDKLMKRMAVVHRKAEEWREAARQKHCQQIQKVNGEARRIQVSDRSSCGCFPCTAKH